MSPHHRLVMTVAPVAVTTMIALTGCHGGSDASTSPTAASASSTLESPATSTTSATSATSMGSTVGQPAACPTENTRSFAKTRFVADLGLTAGTFHRYIYKPYKAGAFDKGAKGRTLALIKAGATAAADVKLLHNATKNVQANPTLCATLAKPIGQLANQLSALSSEVTSGNLAGITSVEPLVSGLMSAATSAGIPVKETTDTTGS